MKFFSVIFLMLLYAGTTSGMVISMHYCGDKIAATEIENFKKDACKKCSAGNKKKCCKTQFAVFKLNEAHQKQTIAASSSQVPEMLLQQYFYSKSFAALVLFKKPFTHFPPLISNQNSYLKNCVLLI